MDGWMDSAHALQNREMGQSPSALSRYPRPPPHQPLLYHRPPGSNLESSFLVSITQHTQFHKDAREGEKQLAKGGSHI